MLTPAFEIQQSSDFLTIFIKAPFAKISETEIFVEENDFKFFSKPYFLRLSLPGSLVEDGRESANYEADKGTFTIKFPKEQAGEHFEGLDMLTKLLAPRGQTRAPPLIEVVSGDSSEGQAQAAESRAAEDEEYDWFVEQHPHKEEPCSLDAPHYGFANQKSGVFKKLQTELCGIVDVPDADSMSLGDRRKQRMAEEQAKFDQDHYLADLYEDDGVQQVLGYVLASVGELELVSQGMSAEDAVMLTDEDKEKMLKLPRKEYLLDQTEENVVYLGLVDLILAYCYNNRTTEGENNVESGWTISKLSAMLSWLEVFSCLEDVVRTSFRRCLCYPLFRHWQLNLAVLQDTAHIFSLGRRKILKCLLEIHTILIDTEARYILNDLYVTDYCVWIQSASKERIQSLAEALSKVCVHRSDVGFDLEEIECKAAEALTTGGVDELTEELISLRVSGNPAEVSASTSSSEESSDDSCESGESDEDSEESLDSDDDTCTTLLDSGKDNIRDDNGDKVDGPHTDKSHRITCTTDSKLITELNPC